MWRKGATCCGIDLFYHILSFYRQQKNPRIARELWWTLVVLFSLFSREGFSRGLAKIVRTRRFLRVREEEEEVDLRFWCPERFLPRHLVRGCPKAWYPEKQKKSRIFWNIAPLLHPWAVGESTWRIGLCDINPCAHFHYEMAWPMFHSRGIFLTKGCIL